MNDDQSERIHVEFLVPTGKREDFLAQLEYFDKMVLPFEVGWRADDQVQRREALTKFADAMELKLRKNDHKRTWREKPIEALFKLLLLEVEEFKVADEFFNVAEARNELVDVSDFALILWDRLGMIEQDRNRHEQHEIDKHPSPADPT